MQEKMIPRHDKGGIFIHWFNAVCWITLTLTGLGLINEHWNPLGGWYPAMMRTIFGSPEMLLNVHMYLGLFWAIVMIIYVLGRITESLAFAKEAFTLNPSRDMTWMVKKNIQLTMGDKMLKKLGMTTDIPPQGFYNAGQKLFAQISIIAGAILIVTGVIMFLSTMVLDNPTPVAWSRTIHYLFATLALAGLIVHIYMAAISREERPAFKSMFTGKVPESYAKHHHELWYNQIKDKI
ncbi:formate dehydrogenase gamma subunit [Desulfonatronospira thiodismutans ASO3-1]|uniref:Formate dehydrogenase gamma subunit n=1 Tax=Desulfonatronospira thiodismutans ASO3-1 TaxID=555779 RepID=D6ST19_9BACT|nr:MULTISPECIES: cytochrome b/b6 domain-containing protein [Desulfonatronospira]EFI33835.1 formate dehydrogenase gamma subunit [Desulfonatronospira thiodismutans ASO3-1]RQD78624.1 MAG: cytochrome B6 [Desulfonatronospira sp. MSAO_Bac3]